MKKYSAKLHVNANNIEKVKFIGSINADSINELKDKARKHARNWGYRGRIHINDDNTNRSFFVNA